MSKEVQDSLIKHHDINTRNANDLYVEANKNVLLVDSGALAIVGFVGNGANIDIATRVLLTTSITLLSLSLLSCIVTTLVNYNFFRRLAKKSKGVLDEMQVVDDKDKNAFALGGMKAIKTSNRASIVLLVTNLTLFALGALCLVAAMVVSIWA